jgi:hypothetical protein
MQAFTLLLSRLQGMNCFIIASSFTSAKIDVVFEKIDALRLIIDPLIKTSPVTIALNFDVNVQVEKHGREISFKNGDKKLIIHRGQRENVSVLLDH